MQSQRARDRDVPGRRFPRASPARRNSLRPGELAGMIPGSFTADRGSAASCPEE